MGLEKMKNTNTQLMKSSIDIIFERLLVLEQNVSTLMAVSKPTTAPVKAVQADLPLWPLTYKLLDLPKGFADDVRKSIMVSPTYAKFFEKTSLTLNQMLALLHLVEEFGTKIFTAREVNKTGMFAALGHDLHHCLDALHNNGMLAMKVSGCGHGEPCKKVYYIPADVVKYIDECYEGFLGQKRPVGRQLTQTRPVTQIKPQVQEQPVLIKSKFRYNDVSPLQHPNM